MTTSARRVGDHIELDFTFRDRSGALADPSAIALVIREPDGTEIAKTHADMTNVSTGLWRYVHAIAKEGRHVAEANGDGIEAVGTVEFYARRKGTS